MMPMLSTQALSVERSGQQVLKDVSFSTGQGEVHALLGGNGAGKSTTLLTFLGFLAPVSGSAHVQGRDVRENVSAARQAIAYLPEAATLYGHLNAYENLRYFLSLAGTNVGRDELDAALDRVALQAGARSMRMQTYSKGMRQKVAIALAILRDAPILLLDEPTSGLDPVAIDEFNRLARGAGRSRSNHSLGHPRCLRRLPCRRPHRPVAEWRACRRLRPSARHGPDRHRGGAYGLREIRGGMTMNKIFTIAREEARLWLRSRLALCALLIFALLLAATSIATSLRMSEERYERSEQQALAEETFLSQPDRHPHRMVHYGHYVFRAPSPLAMIDPGVDAVTGQSIFLEGHRQNTAMFADARASAELGGFEGLTAALVYQLFVPLLLIALGHGLVIREREENTLASLLAEGVTGIELCAGKWVALAGVALALLLPLAVVSAAATARGGSLLASAGIIGLHALYLLVWCGLILFVSTVIRSRAPCLGILALFWLASALIVPRMAVETASSVMPNPGKLETDLRMQAELREVGDGHDAGAPQFSRLQANLLAQYDVERVQDLPVNFRGVVSEAAEANLTEVMNRYAEERMTLEARQAQFAEHFGWLSPVVAVAAGSRALSGTDLATHHRFLREAEAVRFDFVQGLNRVHAEQLAYVDDINRGVDSESERRTRMPAENWNVLDAFSFQPAAADERLARAGAPLAMLFAWFLLATAGGIHAARRLRP